MESSEPIVKHFLSELGKTDKQDFTAQHLSDPAAVRGDTPTPVPPAPRYSLHLHFPTVHFHVITVR